MGMVTFSCPNEDSDDFCFYSTRKNKCARVTRAGTSEDHTKAFQPPSLRGTHGISNFPQRLTRNRAWGILKQRGTILPITLQVVRTSKVRLREYSTSEAWIFLNICLLHLRIKLRSIQLLFPFNWKDASKMFPGPFRTESKDGLRTPKNRERFKNSYITRSHSD